MIYIHKQTGNLIELIGIIKIKKEKYPTYEKQILGMFYDMADLTKPKTLRVTEIPTKEFNRYYTKLKVEKSNKHQ